MDEMPTTAEQAEAMGWEVDRHTYPWMAYLGPRFAPEWSCQVFTPEFDPRQVPSAPPGDERR